MDDKERARARDEKQRRLISLEEKHETLIAAVRKWEMLAATKVKTSGSEKEANRNTYDISSVKLVTRKFHVQNNGNEMYKKVCCSCQVFLFYFGLSDLVAVAV